MKKRQIPHTYAIIFYIILFCAALTWIIPGGQYKESINAAGEKTVVYEAVEHAPQTWQVFSAFYKGFVDKADIIVFILIIAALVQLLETVMHKYMPPLYNALGIYLPLITTNCAVLGVTMLVLEKGAENPSFGYLASLVNAFGAGIGFMVAMVIFAGVRERLELCDVPNFLKGLPITLIAASLVAVSFLGFNGIIDRLLA